MSELQTKLPTDTWVVAIWDGDNSTYQKTGYQEAQPDVSYYANENADAVPWGTSLINLGSKRKRDSLTPTNSLYRARW
jgi:hypothetical protein